MVPDLLVGVPTPGLEPELVLAAAAQVRGICGWHIAPSLTETVKLPWERRGRYVLPSLRVTAVTSVTVNGTAVAFDWSPNGQLQIAPTFGSFGLPSANGPGLWTGGLRGVAVTFTHGYAVCPDDVRQVVLSRAGRLGSERVRSEARTSGPYSFNTTYFDVDVATDLAPYCLPGVA